VEVLVDEREEDMKDLGGEGLGRHY
jgi:hypothetical protein